MGLHGLRVKTMDGQMLELYRHLSYQYHSRKLSKQCSSLIYNPGGGDLEIFIRDGVTKDMVCLILMS